MNKKTIIAVALVCIVIAGILAGYGIYLVSKGPEKEEEPRFALEIYGNANMDEVIDEKDAEFVTEIINGNENETQFADANRDGMINQEDIDQINAILEGTATYIWILDGNGDPVRVRLPIERIGAEYLSNVELMRILGVEDKVVAVDLAPYKLRWFYLPEKADELVNLGNMNAPDYEFILGLNLDVLFTFSYDIAEKKEKLPGVDVVFLGLYWPDVIKPSESRFIQGVMKAGYILGKVDRAQEYVNWLLSLLDSIKSKTVTLSESEKPRVFMTGMVGYIRDASQTTMRTYNLIDPLSQMCILAGGKPIAEDLPDWLGSSYYSTVDPEWVLEENPEYIFVHAVRYTYGGVAMTPAYGYDMNDTSSLNATWQDIMSRPLLSGLSAVQNEKVYIIAGDFRNNAMGSVLGAVYLAKILHPELFEDLDPEAIHQEYITNWMGLNYNLDEYGTFLYPPIVIDGEVIGAPEE
jgi:iron complex transport system substrate-binding protein